MITFKNESPTIQQIYLYTWKKFKNRFYYSERDVLPSRIKIIQKKIYKKNKKGTYTFPSERLLLQSVSAPQYKPYTTLKGKKAKRQMTVKHNYDVQVAIQLYSDKKIYSFTHSKIIWRVGSMKKWEYHPSQKEVKTIFSKTREKLNHKYRKETPSKRKELVKKEVDKIKKNAKYLDVGDFNSRELGINGDFYWRDMNSLSKYGCLYGKCVENIDVDTKAYPFFEKHMLSCIHFLLRKGILKI